MKSLLSIHTNLFLAHVADDSIMPMAEMIFTLIEKTYERALDSADDDASQMQVQATEQYTTIRFMANASECSRTAALFAEQGEQLHQLSQTHGNTIALAGENKVLRDILAAVESYIEEDAPGDADAAKLLQIIQAARAGRA